MVYTTRPAIDNDKDRVAFKLQNLRRLFAWDDEAMLAQRPNIRYLINYYEGGGTGPLPDGSWWLLGGVVVDRQPPLDEWGAGVWEELVCCLPPPLLFHYYDTRDILTLTSYLTQGPPTSTPPQGTRDKSFEPYIPRV